MRIRTFILIILLILTTGFFLKNFLIKYAIENAIKNATGLRVNIDRLHIDFRNTTIHATDLRIYNPAGYPEKVMAYIPDIYVQYDMLSRMQNRQRFPAIRFNLAEFRIIKNRTGQVNLNAIKSVRTANKKTPPPPPAAGKPVQLQIDQLEFKIGRVVYRDYSNLVIPKTTEFNVNLQERYKNVQNMRDVIRLVIVKALINTSIAQMTNFDLDALQGVLSKGFSKATGLATQTTDVAGETIQTLKKTAGDITDKIKSSLPIFNE